MSRSVLQQPTAPLANDKQWLVALGGLFAELNRASVSSLELGDFANESLIQNWERMLNRDWSIYNQQDLQEKLDWLHQEGHNQGFMQRYARWANQTDQQWRARLAESDNETYKAQSLLMITHRKQLKHCGILAYDIGRYVHNVRAAYYVGYLPERDAWQALYRIGPTVQSAFSDWRQFGLSHVVGRTYCRALYLSKQYCDGEFQLLERILMNDRHPWNQLDWDTPLDHDL